MFNKQRYITAGVTIAAAALVVAAADGHVVYPGIDGAGQIERSACDIDKIHVFQMKE